MFRNLTKSRTGWLAIILIGAMAIFVLRLFQLQIVQHGEYVTLAQRSQQRKFVIPASRGEIYMMDGHEPAPVVLNETVYNVVADPSIIKPEQRDNIMNNLRSVAGGEVVNDAQKRLENTDSRYEVLARNITRTQAEKMKEKDFSGILYQQTSRRSYPEGKLASHVLGFVNAEGNGQYGVEGGLNERLKGHDGLLRVVTDVRNVPLVLGKDNIHIEPKSGDNLALTVDRNIQDFTEEALKRGVEKAHATEGSAIVMNPNTGQVLAMANLPTFDPGTYYKEKNESAFLNTSTMSPYEPASVLKAFLLSAGIDRGVITPNSTYTNTDCIQVLDTKMCNAAKGLGGTTTMQSVLNNSLNVGTITVARRLGDGSHINLAARKTIYDYYHNKFGLGEKTGIELGEAGGYIYPPDSVQGNEVRYSAMTYGQSLSLTMIQVSAAFCSVVNGGEYYRPTIIEGTMDKNNKLTKVEHKPLRRTINNSTSDQMRAMLHVARNSVWLANTDKRGYDIGGKTGTAESVIQGQYTKHETVGTYIGYGGAKRPEYVIMIRVAAPGKGLNLEGGLHASPIFSEISNWMIDYLKLAPKG